MTANWCKTMLDHRPIEHSILLLGCCPFDACAISLYICGYSRSSSQSCLVCFAELGELTTTAEAKPMGAYSGLDSSLRIPLSKCELRSARHLVRSCHCSLPNKNTAGLFVGLTMLDPSLGFRIKPSAPLPQVPQFRVQLHIHPKPSSASSNPR